MQAHPVIEETKQFWTVHQVPYRGAREPVDLLKTPLDQGRRRTQDGWAEFSRDAHSRNEFYVGDVPLYHALFSTLYEHREGQQQGLIKRIRTFLHQQFHYDWLATLTRVTYTPSGRDKVTHSCKQADQEIVLENIVGPDEWTKGSTDRRAYKASFGTDDVTEIHNTYLWLVGKDARLWRMDSKPKEEIECIAGFGAGSDWLVLDCSRDQQDSDAALGVRRASEASKSGAAAQKIQVPTLEETLKSLQPGVQEIERSEFEAKLRRLYGRYLK